MGQVAIDGQLFFNIAAGLICFLGGWVVNNISKAIERLDVDVRAMPFNYVTKQDYDRQMQQISDGLKRIYDKIDEKADKH